MQYIIKNMHSKNTVLTLNRYHIQAGSPSDTTLSSKSWLVHLKHMQNLVV